MKRSDMKKGVSVDIYEDPMTETKLEGKAVLIRLFKLDSFGELDHWYVKFSGETETYLRGIKVTP